MKGQINGLEWLTYSVASYSKLDRKVMTSHEEKLRTRKATIKGLPNDVGLMKVGWFHQRWWFRSPWKHSYLVPRCCRCRHATCQGYWSDRSATPVALPSADWERRSWLDSVELGQRPSWRTRRAQCRGTSCSSSFLPCRIRQRLARPSLDLTAPDCVAFSSSCQSRSEEVHFLQPHWFGCWHCLSKRNRHCPTARWGPTLSACAALAEFLNRNLHRAWKGRRIKPTDERWYGDHRSHRHGWMWPNWLSPPLL